MVRTNFWIINSWIIAALVLTVFILHLMGFLEAAKHAKVDCYLGDGIECLETYVYTKETISKSKGVIEDEIVLFFTNNIDSTLYNFSVMLPNCMGLNIVPSVLNNETVTYKVNECKDLKPNGFFRSDLLIKYNIIQDKKSFTIISKGYISNYVYSEQLERVDKTAKKNVFSWINKNVG